MAKPDAANRDSGLVKLIKKLLEGNFRDYEGSDLYDKDYEAIEKYLRRELRKAFRAGRSSMYFEERGDMEASESIAAKYGVKL